MQKNDKYNYTVERGEKVTISFELQGLASSAVSMGLPWALVPSPGPQQQGPVQYAYTIPKPDEPDGDKKLYHSVSEVSFVKPELGAKAKITAEGSKGGGPFPVTTITADTPRKETEIKFWVAA